MNYEYDQSESGIMGFDLLLLCSLIFIFIISFCGLLQKIKRSYERERIIAERLARRQETDRISPNDVYINAAYIGDGNGSGIFPEAPPPYAYVCPPPKYEEVMKSSSEVITDTSNVDVPNRSRPQLSAPANMPPPAYTIS